MAILPALRQELGLYRAPAGYDGEPVWTLHDPASNRFYQIGWPVFEILSRWRMRRSEALISAVNAETTLTISDADVQDVSRFLAMHNLLVAASAQDNVRLASAAAASRPSPLQWLIHNYLFFRVPLIRPMPMLRAIYPLIAFIYRRSFLVLIAIMALAGLFLVSRQWDSFVHTFRSYLSLEGVLAFAIALIFAKILHELGHALTAYRYGCNIPQMGVAFLLLWPMLYTDTSEAWKLASRRQRFAIGAAGTAAELMLAVIATLAWTILPDGPVRAAAFVLATSTWILTIVINASPFTRFDGYFLLADWLNLPNLHERSFALARWWLREILFGFGDAPPEDFARARRGRLIALALFTWLYRLVLFVGIALLLGHFVFKALGLVLMTVELGYFVARPILREMGAWWARRGHMRLNWPLARTLMLLGIVLALVFVPWRGSIGLPAVLVDKDAQTIYAPHDGQLVRIEIVAGQSIAAGDMLAELRSPDLNASLAAAQVRAETLRSLLDQQSLGANLQGAALRRQWEGAVERLAGAQRAVDALTLTAPITGRVAELSPLLVSGTWVGRGEPLALVIGGAAVRGEAFAGDADLDRIASGAPVRFLPNLPERSPVQCRVETVDRVNLTRLDHPAMASTHGGSLPVHILPTGGLEPLRATYRVRIDHCDSSVPTQELAGWAYIEAEPQSLATALWRQLASWARREFAL